MGIKKTTYKKKSKRLSAKRAADERYGNVIMKMNGVWRNVLQDYITFIDKLDDPTAFRFCSKNVKVYSRKWNSIRQKHIPSTELKRVYSWKEKSPYLFQQLSKYIKGKYLNRGLIIEKFVIKVLISMKWDLRSQSRLFIHEYIPWLDTTPDGVLYVDNHPIAVLETKTFTSQLELNKTMRIVNGSYRINTESRSYYHMQVAAEIVNVPFIVFVFEHELKLNLEIIRREYDFLKNRFDRLVTIYWRFIVPYKIYDEKNSNKRGFAPKISHFDEKSYTRLLRMLNRYEKIHLSSKGTRIVTYPTESAQAHDQTDSSNNNIEVEAAIETLIRNVPRDGLLAYRREINLDFTKYRINNI